MPSLFEPERVADASPRGAYVRVAVERGIDAAGGAPFGSLTYLDAEGDLRPGDSVHVPLGRTGRLVGGFVVEAGGAELLGGVDPARVKPVAGRRGGRLTPALLELSAWMSQYYVCPRGMVLATMAPAAVKRGTGRRTKRGLVLAPEPPAGVELSARAREAWKALASLPAGSFPGDAGELALLIGHPTRRAINELVRRGLLAETTYETTTPRAPLAAPADELAGAKDVTLNEDQARAVGGIASGLGRFGTHLLWGVTGSGKTEVYLRLIERVLAGGRGAIVLVPEIALTPQACARFTGRFGGGRVAVLHSGLTDSQRHHEWTRVRDGEARVVVGARSAVFAPVASPGLIVVDEEHDPSYKQDQLPRYLARDVAIKRAQIEGCAVVLGSATPSMESFANALPAESGGLARATLWELPRRAGPARLPEVVLVDLSAERRELARQGVRTQRLVGPTLEREIHATLEAGGQVVLLLNRRGFAGHIACPSASCGFVLTCRHCDAGMVHHKDRALPLGSLVRCHHCLAEQVLPALCPRCGKRLGSHAAGTQRAEEELEALFAAHGLSRGRDLLRMDSDTMRRGRDYFEALSRFARGEVRVLLGTQMIAKGLDVANVRLVGVLDADTALRIPDFRSEERTFQLIAQVAGRAGRGEHRGRVVVQTLVPRARSVSLAAAHGYAEFARGELAIRRAAGLPPYARMARIVARDRRHERAQALALEVARTLREGSASLAIDARIDGPGDCAIARVAEHYRVECLATTGRAAELVRLLDHARARGVLKSDSRTSVDVDPVTFL